ncbi:hypothetical protein [Xenorhabdus lircayensis]|nr:hypothetical protein [Xenorhabdus lircayensis]
MTEVQFLACYNFRHVKMRQLFVAYVAVKEGCGQLIKGTCHE